MTLKSSLRVLSAGMWKQDCPACAQDPAAEQPGIGRTVPGPPGGLVPQDPVSETSQLSPWTCIPGATTYVAAELRSLACD